MIQIKNLHKSYPIGKDSLHVLKGIDLHIKEGEFVSIMGSSGSGKSTLLNIVGLLDNYDAGEYYLNNQLIQRLNERKAAILRNKFLGELYTLEDSSKRRIAIILCRSREKRTSKNSARLSRQGRFKGLG